MEGFHSKVLTSILVQQLEGIHDAYTPFIQRAANWGSQEPVTIEAATRYYLSRDPIDPIYHPVYCQNALYTPIPCWVLGNALGNVVKAIGKHTKKQIEENAKIHCGYYNQFIKDHDLIMARLIATGGHKMLDANGITLLLQVEVDAIVTEQLDIYFEPELVRFIQLISPVARIDITIQRNPSMQYHHPPLQYHRLPHLSHPHHWNWSDKAGRTPPMFHFSESAMQCWYVAPAFIHLGHFNQTDHTMKSFPICQSYKFPHCAQISNYLYHVTTPTL